MGSWRDRLRDHPRVVKARRLRWTKLKSLARDDKFLFATARTRGRLTKALLTSPKQVKRLFTLFPYPTGPTVNSIRRHLQHMNDKGLAKLFWSYVRYASRYGVYFM